MRKRGTVPNHMTFSPVSENTVITPVEPWGRWQIKKERPRGWLAGLLFGLWTRSPELIPRAECTSQGHTWTDIFCCLSSKLGHPGCYSWLIKGVRYNVNLKLQKLKIKLMHQKAFAKAQIHFHPACLHEPFTLSTLDKYAAISNNPLF